MKNFIRSLTKNDTFFKIRKNIIVKDVTKINATMFPSKISFENAEKFLSIYDKSGSNQKVLLTYEVMQETKTAKGFQLYVKFLDDLYIILDRRESQAPGAGQLYLRYLSNDGKKLGSIHFHGSAVFEKLTTSYNIEILKLMAEQGCSMETAENLITLFIF